METKTASTNDSKPKQETKKATQKSSSQQEMKSSHSSVTGQNSNVTGENPSENATQPSAGTDETNEVPQNQAPDTNITITNVVSILKEMKLMVLHYLMQPLQQR